MMESLLILNFADELTEEIYKAGINLVTNANNCLLDKKIDGAMITPNILDKYNTFYVGSYRNFYEKKKNKIFIRNIKNVKIIVINIISKYDNKITLIAINKIIFV